MGHDAEAAMEYKYLAYGLTVASSLRLPELIEAPKDSLPEVFVSFETLDNPIRDLPNKGSRILSTAEGTYLYWSQIGLFRVSGGRDIAIDAFEGTPEQTIRLPLLGIVFGTLLHQRGTFTLHASTVSVNGSAVAFLGWKGAGKSTMAASLQRRGHTLLTDDILALDFRESERDRVEVIPSYPQLKLWPSAASALGSDPESLSALHPDLSKRALRSRSEFNMQRVPLAGLYVLSFGDSFSSEKLSGKDGMLQLLSHSYAARFLGTDAAGIRHFRRCAWLAERVPICQLVRSQDLSKLDEVAGYLEELVRDAAQV